jgi:Zn finger protein HypA/HybF involved in hydrogenase expression
MSKQVTTESFIKRAQKVHGFKYDYSKTEYINAKTKVTIICPVHGEFKQFPNNHLKYNCNKCGNISAGLNGTLKTEDFINKAKSVHGNKYDYTKVIYSKSKEKVTIMCRDHGEFKQTPSDHLQSRGCPKCRNSKLSINPWSYSDWEVRGNESSNFDSFKVYILKCWNSSEMFYKIGKTYVSIGTRFKYKKEMPYEWELLKVYEGSAKAMSELEHSLQTKCKDYVYLPQLSFGGRYECFSSIRELDALE